MRRPQFLIFRKSSNDLPCMSPNTRQSIRCNTPARRTEMGKCSTAQPRALCGMNIRDELGSGKSPLNRNPSEVRTSLISSSDLRPRFSMARSSVSVFSHTATTIRAPEVRTHSCILTSSVCKRKIPPRRPRWRSSFRLLLLGHTQTVTRPHLAKRWPGGVRFPTMAVVERTQIGPRSRSLSDRGRQTCTRVTPRRRRGRR